MVLRIRTWLSHTRTTPWRTMYGQMALLTTSSSIMRRMGRSSPRRRLKDMRITGENGRRFRRCSKGTEKFPVVLGPEGRAGRCMGSRPVSVFLYLEVVYMQPLCICCSVQQDPASEVSRHCTTSFSVLCRQPTRRKFGATLVSIILIGLPVVRHVD